MDMDGGMVSHRSPIEGVHLNINSETRTRSRISKIKVESSRNRRHSPSTYMLNKLPTALIRNIECRIHTPCLNSLLTINQTIPANRSRSKTYSSPHPTTTPNRHLQPRRPIITLGSPLHLLISHPPTNRLLRNHRIRPMDHLYHLCSRLGNRPHRPNEEDCISTHPFLLAIRAR